ncbi:MAG: TerC family protein [Thiobacillus sp.]|uniref:TerC family protein n=1 Tax=Thiobacillus sp. TaxID=924 RepID=UPI0028943DCD|nr:TerC family protein [Thiobacillus sp.]MDT3705883.1 TerC family protein [Thiobacillus sp.]
MDAVPHIGEPWMWAAFIGFVLAMLAVDLFLVGGNKAHRIGFREAAAWSLAWFSLAMLFNLWLWWHLKGAYGSEVADVKALEFLTGYLIEKSLALDNIFVFLMIFGYFAVPPEYQRRVLIYGVIGAIALRAVMILAGAWLVQEFHWILYVFGAFLVVTGVRMLMFAKAEPDLASNPLLKWIRRHMRLTPDYRGEKFRVTENGVRTFTPLFLVLVMIELSDLFFAVDSIPAIFAITTDPFIVFTSNIFAILGLRAMYFILAGMADRFHLLKYGLALVLVFVGTKMLIVDFFKIPVGLSLGIVGLIIAGFMFASLWLTRKQSGPG